MKRAVLIIAVIVGFCNSAQAIEYGVIQPVGRTSKLIALTVLADNGADTSEWYSCATFSAMSVQFKAHGNTHTDSNGVSAVLQWSNSPTTPGTHDGSFRSGLVKDSISTVFGDTNWVIANMTVPPAKWYRVIVRPTAANKIDETGGGTTGWVRIFWIRDLFTR
jgi:hypothetical protein